LKAGNIMIDSRR